MTQGINRPLRYGASTQRGQSSGGGPPPPPSNLPSIWWAEIESKMDSKIAVSVAQMDTKLSNFKNEIDTVQSTLIKWLIGVVGTAFIAGIGIILTFLSFGSDRFDGGMQASSVTMQQSIEAKQLAQENAKQIQELIELAKKPKK